jgi:uncharacterized protein with PIN domain
MNNDNGTPKKTYDVRSLGIEETDSCPVCKRQLKALIEENEGGCIQGRMGEWICFACGTMFIPKSRLRKMIEAFKAEESRIIKPQFILPSAIKS